MLILSTTPNSAYLLHLAEHIIQSNPPMIQDALELVGMAGVTKSTWELRLRIANILAAKGKIDDVKDVISGINAAKYIRQFDKLGQIKLLLNVFITLNRIDEALNLFESEDIAGRITSTDDFGIRFRIVNALINRGQTDRAKKLFFEIDVKKAYAENLELKDVYSRIGWALYWPKKDYAKVIEWFDKDLFISGNHQQISDTYSYNSRLSPAWRLNYAQALAVTGDIDHAEKQVAMAYAENPALKDGYSRIGWALYWPKKDYAKVIEWFDKDLFISGNHEQTSDTYSYNNRSSPAWRLNYAQALAVTGDIDHAEKQVAMAYAENPALKDGYCRVAWSYFLDKKDYSSIEMRIKRDEDANRLSPIWRLNQAKVVAKTENMKAAIPIIEKAYSENSNLENAFGEVAWLKYIPEDWAYDRVVRYFEKDLQRDKLKGEWLLNYAQSLILIERKDEAKKYVFKAYSEAPDLANGFARCALAKYFNLTYKPELALLWFEMDISLDRLSGMYRIYYATLLAATGDMAKAISVIERAYNEDQSLNEGYAFIGWHYSLIKKQSPREALDWFKKDISLHKLQLNMKRVLAGLYAYMGERAKAEKIIKQCYKTNKKINSGYFIIGVCDYARNNDLDYLIECIEKDVDFDRLFPSFLNHIYGKVLLAAGNTQKAKKIIKETLLRSNFAHIYAISWIERLISPKKTKEVFNILKREGGIRAIH